MFYILFELSTNNYGRELEKKETIVTVTSEKMGSKCLIGGKKTSREMGQELKISDGLGLLGRTLNLAQPNFW